MRHSLILLFAFLLLLPPSAAAFCSAPQPRLVCAEYFSSPVIVQATLLRTSYEAETPDKESDAHIYSLHVNRVLRGTARQTIDVYEENSSGRATFNWVPRTDYLLFLFPSSEKKGMWQLDSCGNSGPLNGAIAALEEIAKVKSGTNGGGMIQGVVNGPNFSATQPSSGMHVQAKGASGLFRAVTNKDGEFRINVPAGHYVVSVNEPGLSFRPFEFTYEKPDAVEVQPGGCAQVQFVDSQR